MILHYVRDFNRNPVALFLLDGDMFGWSACNWRQGEKFNKKKAFQIAESRMEKLDLSWTKAMAWTDSMKKMPLELIQLVPLFVENPKHEILVINKFDIHNTNLSPNMLFMSKNNDILTTLLKMLDKYHNVHFYFDGDDDFHDSEEN